jgi:hypothetical protein
MDRQHLKNYRPFKSCDDSTLRSLKVKLLLRKALDGVKAGFVCAMFSITDPHKK